MLDGSAQSPPSGASAAPQVDFNWHIRPILSENCFQCHGPDVKNNSAEMRLDIQRARMPSAEGRRGRGTRLFLETPTRAR